MKNILLLLLIFCVTCFGCSPVWESKQIGWNGVKLWRLWQPDGWLVFVEASENSSTAFKRDENHTWNWNG